MTRSRLAWVAVGAAAFLTTAVPFFAATTFIGDDHLFLTFSRHAPSPLVPFFADQHGGEYYRPFPMAIWWLLGRSGGGQVAFAALALLSHAAASMLLGQLVRSLGRPTAVWTTAAAVAFLAPQSLEAAYWYSASTDLFATAFVLAALVAAVRDRPILSSAAALGAFLSKESAYVLPALTFLLVAGRPETPGHRRRYLCLALQLAGLGLVLLARTAVLGGWGASADGRPGATGKVVQVASGVLQVFTGSTVLPQPIALGLGAAALALCLYATARRHRPGRWQPFLFAALAVVPLAAAGWAVGARYYYLAGLGLAWAMGEVLASTGTAARLVVGLCLLGLGLLQAGVRRPDIVSYQRRVEAARRAVLAGLAEGHRLFHVDGGVKDLDLAVKGHPDLASASDQFLVLADVPASFAIVPRRLFPGARIFVADPPLPPRGAYELGEVRVVGLARRGDEPSLDEVLSRFPDLRFIRLRAVAGGQIIARDRTDEIKRSLDSDPGEGQ